MNKKEKGNFGYINHYKKMQGIIGFASLAMVFVIYFTGYFTYHTNKSLFSVIAAVSVLPAAKYLIGFFVVFPYRSSDKRIFDELTKLGTCGLWKDVRDDAASEDDKEVKYENEGCTFISDMIFTYDSKIMNIDYIVINRGHVLAYSDNKKLDYEYAGGYIKKILDNSCNYMSFKMYSDEDEFMKNVRKVCDSNTDTSHKILKNDMIIAKKLLPFSI